MKKQTYNPILPLDEYIPDVEPHVFDNRLYLFGSHDSENGLRYCAEKNYVCYSSPLDEPNNFTFHGVIYDARQDPDYKEGINTDLYAPDVVKGNDGRYYLYYCFAGEGGHNKVNVAVCDSPCGKYEYYGFVKNLDGTIHHEYLMGDPAVINDNGQIRLYCGWSLSSVAAGAHRGKGFSDENKTNRSNSMQMPKPGSAEMKYALAPVYKMLFKRELNDVLKLKYPLMGANEIDLEDDMLTIKGEVNRIVPGQYDTPSDSSFFNHAFYEASSIRKINGLYYFIYSSENSNELCYATSKYPNKDFTFRGTIISNGDVGYNGIKDDDRLNQTANDHGSIECINNRYYIFHHRQTNRSTFSRQVCAEEIKIEKDGTIKQVECTSIGLNGKPLSPSGYFDAAICCNLTNGQMPHITNTIIDDDIPYITCINNERIITNIKNNTLIGYKYFDFNGKYQLSLNIKGKGKGYFSILDELNHEIDKVNIYPSDKWNDYSCVLDVQGIKPLYLKYIGEGAVDFKSFKISEAK